MTKLYIFGQKTGKTLTVGELIETIQGYDRDEEVYIIDENNRALSISEDEIHASDEIIFQEIHSK